ncbi:hypothetical protein OG483_17410 [[Kitasatospora] papulosa]|uniref:hypothetical protein n=1 Tax=[Kitasatospora] papulosa TaxID=1464011 RepID=UPI002E11B335|nr:hypothetical protein OG483_17410 [[Kitasatospora] papulosa]
MAYEDRTYHGVQNGPENPPRKGEEPQPASIFVEKPEFGPTERREVTVLYELRPEDPERVGGFGWGYNGHGTSRAAAAILADALDLTDPREPGDLDKVGIAMTGWPQDDVLVGMREDFCDDVLSQCCDQWRLRRGVVLRWARAWYLQQGIDELPDALQELSPLASNGA